MGILMDRHSVASSKDVKAVGSSKIPESDPKYEDRLPDEQLRDIERLISFSINPKPSADPELVRVARTKVCNTYAQRMVDEIRRLREELAMQLIQASGG